MSQDWEQKLARYAGATPDAARRDASGYATTASAPPARTMGEVLEALVAEQQKQTALLEGILVARRHLRPS